jgi:HEAT repeat protein
MRRRKAHPEDEKLIYDEAADPVERSSAMLRLAVDGFGQMEPLLQELLKHSHEMLRSEAISILLGGWKKATYFEHGVQMLHSDREPQVRSSVALALCQFVSRNEEGTKYRDRVIRELTRALLQDQDGFVRSGCYEEILKLHNPGKFNFDLPDELDLERDVDWSLLKPYLNADAPS